MRLNEEELKEFIELVQEGELSSYTGNIAGMMGGKHIQELEKEWAKFYGVKHAIAVNSATSGLWCALGCVLKNNTQEYYFGNDEVIVTPYSMTCSASLPLLFGARPVFADIEKDYFCLDPESIEKNITKYTKAIVVVDLFGQCYDRDRINAIAKKHNLVVIEDASQAPYSKYKGKFAGTLGDIGVYSLNFHKHIECGEGGIVVTDNDEYAHRIRLLMNHSEAIINDIEYQTKTKLNLDDTPNVDLIGMNLRMTELQAFVARTQLKRLPEIMKRYISNSKMFNMKVRPECTHSYYRYAMTDFRRMTDEFFYIKKGYITPIHKMPLFRQMGYNQDQCPNCDWVEDNIVLAWRK